MIAAMVVVLLSLGGVAMAGGSGGASSEEQIKVIDAEVARVQVIVDWLQRQRDQLLMYLARLQDRRAELTTAKEPGKEKKNE
ncbi:MAG TPA: hypothetical protein PK659_09400 [Methanothrix sp.]|nr:hypothetical protein [Methanothrix sp.]HOL44454.1 hypothetical protein [Methanothrix sp.]